MSVLLSRDAILNAAAVTKDVEVFGGTARIRALSLARRLELSDAVAANSIAHDEWLKDQELPEGERKGVEKVTVYDQALVSILFAFVDEAGDWMFTVEDYPLFLNLDYPDIVRLWGNLQDLSIRVAPEDQKKSSASTRKGGSSSGSRVTSRKR